MAYWDSFKATYGALSEGMEDERKAIRADRYGEAYRSGGWTGARDVAAEEGDIDSLAAFENNAWTGEQRTAQRSDRERETRNRGLTVFNNVLTSLQGVPYEQRKARIQQIAPRLMQEGFTQEQIAGYDPTDERIASDLAAAGQFSQYAEIKKDEAGRWLGVTRDGRVEPIPGAPAPVPEYGASQQTGEVYGIDPLTGQVVRPEGNPTVPGADIIRRGADAGVRAQERAANAPYSTATVGARPMTAEDGAQWRVENWQDYMMDGGKPVPIRQPTAPRSFTQDASLAAGFARRMETAAAQLKSAIADPQFNIRDVYNPLTTNPAAQRYRRAQRDFINAQLRRESGATIQDSEFQSAAQQYFPTPQDWQNMNLRAEKIATWDAAANSMRAQSQGAYEAYYVEPQQRAAGGSVGATNAAPPAVNQLGPTPGAPPPRPRNVPPTARWDAQADGGRGMWVP